MPPNSKFSGIDFSNLPIEHLTPDRNITGQGFRCEGVNLSPIGGKEEFSVK